MTINSFITDTSSLILLDKVNLLNTFASKFQLITTKSVVEEFNKGSKNSLNNNLFSIEPLNAIADLDILKLLDKYKNSAILTDDLKILKIVNKQNLNYVSTIVIPYILLYFQALNKKDLEKYVSRIVNIGFYSKKVIKTAESFEKNLPMWMREISFKS